MMHVSLALCLCLVFLDLLTPGLVNGEDVVGCGGFVRSNFPVDFTRIQVCKYKHSDIREIILVSSPIVLGDTKYQVSILPIPGSGRVVSSTDH